MVWYGIHLCIYPNNYTHACCAAQNLPQQQHLGNQLPAEKESEKKSARNGGVRDAANEKVYLEREMLEMKIEIAADSMN